ncbi:hydroxymethylbilane synthase [Neorhodopirellula lusitana]|uniref:hydroxymethylbilane synthase n=1 Tax=Neorhodopirellula lusitana TaxID=445327 RepID=UPI00384FC59F
MNSANIDQDRPLRIATRESPLAMWQAHYVAAKLLACGVETTLVPLVSGGDTDMRPIDGTRQVGLFTKRIQQALVDDEADIAVHSLKDLPTAADERFVLAAVAERETVTDSFVTLDGKSLSDLAEGAKVGTGSTRRVAQLKSLRPDLEILPIRGNVQTRLSKLASGEFAAIVLAEAGLLRLEMDDVKRVSFSLDEMLPAPGQGALGIEVRANEPVVLEAVSKLDDLATRLSVTTERTILAALHGGCLAPIAAYSQATMSNDQVELTLKARVMSVDGHQRLEETASASLANDSDVTGMVEKAADLGRQVADRFREAGAEALIQSAR